MTDTRLLLALALIGAAAAAGPAAAQDQPPIPKTAVRPDPTHATFILPKDLQWKRESLGQLQAPLYGDPNKPGPYGVVIKWPKGQMSHPHYHTTDRFAYVVQGTWWVATSETFDPATTYPLPQGSFATDLANKVHWDGSKDEDLILLVTGMGPMQTVQVPEKPPARK
jgi:quercetin dioxygenase-like cupin family protein